MESNTGSSVFRSAHLERMGIVLLVVFPRLFNRLYLVPPKPLPFVNRRSRTNGANREGDTEGFFLDHWLFLYLLSCLLYLGYSFWWDGVFEYW
jgi:hypothetical protein